MGINIQQIYSGISAQIKNFIMKSLPGANYKVVDLDLSTKWAQNAQNARFEDTPGAVDKRAPVSYYNQTLITSAPVTGLYRYYTSTGADLWISTCGTGAYVGNDANGSFSQIRSSLTTGKRHQFVVYQDLLMASNGFDPIWVYDADTVNNVTWELGSCKALISTATGSMGAGTYYYAVTTCASAGSSGVTTVDTWVSGAISNTINMGAANGIDSFTKLMLHCDGTNGGTTFTDSELTPKTVTANGNAQTSTAQQKFGSASGLFGGGGIDSYTKLMLHFENNVTDSELGTPKTVTNNNVTFSNTIYKFGSYSAYIAPSSSNLSIPGNTDFDFSGGGPWTVDFWFYLTSYPSGYFPGTFFSMITDANNFFRLSLLNSGAWEPNLWIGGVNTIDTYTGPSPALNTWNHFAMTYSSGAYTFYLNGVAFYTVGSAALFLNFSNFYIGFGIDQYGQNFDFGGTGAYIDEFRISKGIERWSSTFVPPSAPYATGDYLTVPDSADFNMGTGDFTLDFWVYFNYLFGQQDFLDKSTSTTYSMQFTKQANGTLRMFFTNGTSTVGDYVTTTAPALTTGAWNHLAFVRNGSNAFIFLNGTSLPLTINTAWGTLVQGTTTLQIAGDSTNIMNFLNGYLDEIRLSKGIARWTTNFTPPTLQYSGATFTSATLSHIPLGPPGTAARKIYRTAANGSSLEYAGIIEDNSTTTYIDTVADGSLGAAIPSTTDAMPKGALLTLHLERFFISGDPSNPNYIYYSEVYLPHYIQQTTQLTYMQIANDDGDTITGIPIQLGLMVCIKRNSVRQLNIGNAASGADPTTWFANDPLAWIGSPAPYSVTQTPSGIVFLGYDHWYIFDGASVQPIIDEFDTENILTAAYNDTVGYYNNGIFLAAYTDITSAASAHNRIMRWNFRRQALGIDVWTSSTLTGANCFAGRIGDNEDGDLFYGDSVAGYIVKDQNSESVYSLITQADANSGMLSNIFVGGSIDAPSITIGAADSPTAIPNNICIFWDNETTTPGSGWTEITGFNNNCILISSTVNPLTTDPGVSHAHLLSGAIPTWTGNTVNAGDGNPGAVGAHTHLVESFGDPTTPLPRNTFLRLFKKNSNTIEYQFPTGSIIMYDQTSTPTGWISLNSEGLTGYYVALNQGGTQYAFAVSGVSVWPSIGDAYTDNSATFTITFSPISGSAGIIYATSSAGDPEASGNLIVASGGGDSTIAFSVWQSQVITLSTPNVSTHTHTFDIPTGTAAGSLANSDSGTNCPAFGHDHVVAGELATVNMDTVNSSPWEVANVGFNFIKLVGATSSWDGTIRNAYCLFAGSEAMSNGWTEATATYTGNYLKIIAGSPTIGGPANNSHTHTAGTFITSTENALWGNNGYRATCYAGPHTHQVTLTASAASCGNPPSVAFRLCYKILGQMNIFNDAISNQYMTGTYTSSAQQINALSMDKLFWNQQISGAADSIQFYFRSGSTQAICLAASYTGPYTNPNGSDISSTVNPIWVQYQIVFNCVNSTINNPSVYFTGGYAVQYTYSQGTLNAETSVNFIYSIGLRNLDTPTADKIYKKISTTHIGSAGSFTFSWATENASDSMLVSLASNPNYWDSYFQSTAMGKQIDITVSKNDLNTLKLKQIELFYSGMQVIV